MKRMTIEIGDKPIVLEPEMMIEVKEENPIESGKPMCSSSAWY